jgi:acetoacetyl-CoA synthetase
MSELLWQPSAQRIEASNMRRFMDEVGRENDYATLYEWSIREPAEFWGAAWDFFRIRAASEYRCVVEDFDRMPGARWFEGATLNFADNLLRPEHSAAAIVAYDEAGARTVLERDELRRQVASVAQALSAYGVGPGDRVAGYLPNCAETVVAMLATASLGGVWSACSPDFGLEALIDRLGQIGAKVLFATDGSRYNGKTIDTLPVSCSSARRAGADPPQARLRPCASRIYSSRRSRRPMSPCRSRIRSIFCTPRALPGRRRPSCTASVER